MAKFEKINKKDLKENKKEKKNQKVKNEGKENESIKNNKTEKKKISTSVKFTILALILIAIFCVALTPVTLQNDTYCNRRTYSKLWNRHARPIFMASRPKLHISTLVI